MTLLTSPFRSFWVSAGARLTPFAGWELPVQFQGVMAEHHAVRKAAGLFDISHMGQVWVSGEGAPAFLDQVTTLAASALPTGRGAYSLFLNKRGGVVDDLFVYRLEESRYFLVVNASRRSADMAWLEAHAPADVTLLEQPQGAALALQGPQAAELLGNWSRGAVALPRFGLGEFNLLGMDILVARTGYTGEDGFEFFGPAGHVVPLLGALLERGPSLGMALCGLGARDTLRLDMGYRLYGQDLDESHSALEAGLSWVVDFKKPSFIGREALLVERQRGPLRRLVGFQLAPGSGVPRHGYVLSWNGEPVGEITSGTFSPTLGYGIALGYVRSNAGPEGLWTLALHGRSVPLQRTALPFLKPAVRPLEA